LRGYLKLQSLKNINLEYYRLISSPCTLRFPPCPRVFSLCLLQILFCKPALSSLALSRHLSVLSPYFTVLPSQITLSRLDSLAPAHLLDIKALLLHHSRGVLKLCPRLKKAHTRVWLPALQALSPYILESPISAPNTSGLRPSELSSS
jgi:hypothetical protein